MDCMNVEIVYIASSPMQAPPERSGGAWRRGYISTYQVERTPILWLYHDQLLVANKGFSVFTSRSREFHCRTRLGYRVQDCTQCNSCSLLCCWPWQPSAPVTCCGILVQLFQVNSAVHSGGNLLRGWGLGMKLHLHAELDLYSCMKQYMYTTMSCILWNRGHKCRLHPAPPSCSPVNFYPSFQIHNDADRILSTTNLDFSNTCTVNTISLGFLLLCLLQVATHMLLFSTIIIVCRNTSP